MLASVVFAALVAQQGRPWRALGLSDSVEATVKGSEYQLEPGRFIRLLAVGKPGVEGAEARRPDGTWPTQGVLDALARFWGPEEAAGIGEDTVVLFFATDTGTECQPHLTFTQDEGGFETASQPWYEAVETVGRERLHLYAVIEKPVGSGRVNVKLDVYFEPWQDVCTFSASDGFAPAAHETETLVHDDDVQVTFVTKAGRERFDHTLYTVRVKSAPWLKGFDTRIWTKVPGEMQKHSLFRLGEGFLVEQDEAAGVLDSEYLVPMNQEQNDRREFRFQARSRWRLDFASVPVPTEARRKVYRR